MFDTLADRLQHGAWGSALMESGRRRPTEARR